MYWKRQLLVWGLVAALAVFLGGALPAQAQSGVVWQGEYYDNAYLQGQPFFVRFDNAVAFDWGLGSPRADLTSDGFSVRWVGDSFFRAGTYRFWVLADDNVQLRLDNGQQPFLTTFDQNRQGQIVSADIAISEGNHRVQVDYQELSGNAYVYVAWANLASNPTGPNFPVSPVNTGAWTAQYYANATLSGTPSLIQSEGDPSKSWGAGSPTVSIPADNFSARWTSVQNLQGGTYTVSVKADDGVRVWVNGGIVIDRWGTSTGETFTATLNLPAGPNTFQIEYFEASGEAFIEYRLTSGTPQAPAQAAAPSGATATVTAARLNVRATPDVGAAVLFKISQNESYAIVGRSQDGGWWQISVNGVNGWVSARFVRVNGQPNVSVVVPSQGLEQPRDTGYDITAQSRLNVRQSPSTSAVILARMARGEIARVVGRTANNQWWQVDYAGTRGWVSSRWGLIQGNAQTSLIPVTG